MTILEALERAKRNRAERLREAGATPSVDTNVPVRRKKLDIVAAPVATLNFPRLSLDPAVCEKNRLVLATQSGLTHARVVDSYRILRTRLRRRVIVEQSVSLGIVSAGADEGKSLTSINLALAFASEKRQNVFLIDLDLRNPSLCRYLGVSPRVEIGNCLSSTARPEDVFFTVGVDNLILAGGITSHENSSELLGGSALTELIEYIRKEDPYALIMIDLPPLLLSADALVVAPHITAMLLVVAEGVTRRDQLSRAAEALAGVTVAGVVLNRSREAVEDYYG